MEQQPIKTTTELTKDILLGAADLLETKGWTQGAYAKNILGDNVSPLDDRNAACYCAFGSIQRAMMYVRNASAENPAYIFSKHLKLSIPIWNDDKNMTKEKVIKTMRDFANSL